MNEDNIVYAFAGGLVLYTLVTIALPSKKK